MKFYQTLSDPVGLESRSQRIQKLLDRLKNNDEALINLDLQYNNIEDQEAKILAKSLLTNKTLISLNLGNNNITKKGAKDLADLLASAYDANEVRDPSSSNWILQADLMELPQASWRESVVPTNKTLMSLDFSHNNIGELGAKYLFNSLLTNKTLTNLNIMRNNCDNIIGDLVNVLLTNKTLLFLSIESNYISNQEFKNLTNSLLINKTLISLELFNNNIGDQKVQYLANALLTNTILTSIYLGGNNIGENAIIPLVNILRWNMSLTYLGGDISNQIRIPIDRNYDLANQLLCSINEENIIQVEELLECGVSSVMADWEGNTAMHLAIIRNNSPAIKQLLSFIKGNTSLFILNEDTKTPLDLAKEKDNPEILALLKLEY